MVSYGVLNQVPFGSLMSRTHWQHLRATLHSGQLSNAWLPVLAPKHISSSCSSNDQGSGHACQQGLSNIHQTWTRLRGSLHLQTPCIHNMRGFASSSAATSGPLVARKAGAHEQVVPEAIISELRQIDEALQRASSIDGLKRLTLSKTALPQPIPAHEVEPGLHTITAHVRAVEGSNACKWLRKAGRTPIRVQSLWPGGRGLLLHVDTRDAERLVRLYGRSGCQARIVALQITHPDDPAQTLGSIRVKPQEVHMTSYRNHLENIDFLYCPQDRLVYVNVPIKLVNDDIAPGVKAGGWMFMERRTVRYQARGDSIPPYIEVDVKDVALNQVVRVRDLPVPVGARLPGPSFHDVVLRCTTSVGKE